MTTDQQLTDQQLDEIVTMPSAEDIDVLVAEVRRLRADRSAAALAEVRRFCETTVRASVRVQAIDQARDTLAVIDSVMGTQQGDDEGLSGPCDCGEGAVHYTVADCPAAAGSAAASEDKR